MSTSFMQRDTFSNEHSEEEEKASFPGWLIVLECLAPC